MYTQGKETFQVLKLNIKNILLFEFLFRLITIPVELNLISQSLAFALKRARYSYLTAGNLLPFLVKPWTLLCLIVIAVTGMFLMTMEIACLITAFQGAAYYRKLNVMEIFWGGFCKVLDELRKKNGRIFLIAVLDFFLTHLFFLYRSLTHIKPFNFVMMGIFENPAAVVIILFLLMCLMVLAVATLFLFHGCMVEQKNFRDSMVRSWQLLIDHLFPSVIQLVLLNAAVTAVTAALYVIGTMFVRIFVSFTAQPGLEIAIRQASCDKVEIALLSLASVAAVLVNFAALTVQYFQYSSRLKNEPRWDFAFPRQHERNKKVVAGAAAVIACLSIFYIYDVVRNGSALAGEVLAQTQITAHRGSSKRAPENTLPAIEAAIEDMADYAEIDVQESADGIVVLCHDKNLKRIAGLNKTVGSLNVSELQQLDAGSWFSEEFAGTPIPMLEEVMELSKGRINLNIEIKKGAADSGLAAKVMELVQKFDMKEQCVITSTSLAYLRKVKEIDPDIRTGYIVSAAYGDYYSNEYVDFISLRSSFVNEKLVGAAHECGKAVHAWTVNKKSEIERMRLLGVDNIITDYPVKVRELLAMDDPEQK